MNTSSLPYPWDILLKDGEEDLSLYLINHETKVDYVAKKEVEEGEKKMQFKKSKQGGWHDNDVFQKARVEQEKE